MVKVAVTLVVLVLIAGCLLLPSWRRALWRHGRALAAEPASPARARGGFLFFVAVTVALSLWAALDRPWSAWTWLRILLAVFFAASAVQNLRSWRRLRRRSEGDLTPRP